MTNISSWGREIYKIPNGTQLRILPPLRRDSPLFTSNNRVIQQPLLGSVEAINEGCLCPICIAYKEIEEKEVNWKRDGF